MKKKIKAAKTPTPRMTPMATPAFAPEDMPWDAALVVDDALAAESVADPVDVAAKALISVLGSAVVLAEVIKEDVLCVSAVV
jgi:hypothetical protein